MIADTLLIALSLSLPPRAAVNRVPALLPPAQPVVVRVADVRPPESLSTCYQGRSGSCWTEE